MGIAEQLARKHGLVKDDPFFGEVVDPGFYPAINEAFELAAREAERPMGDEEECRIHVLGEGIERETAYFVGGQKFAAKRIRALKSESPEHTEVQE